MRAARLAHGLGVALVAFLALTAGGCRSLKIEDGKLACGDKGECPSGYVCRQSKCYRPGAGDGGAGTGGHAGRDAGDAAGAAGAGGAKVDGAAGASPDGGPAGDGGPPDNPPVTVTILRNGNGTVQGQGVDCKDASCTVQVPVGTTLVLQATAGADSRLEAWSGCTSMTGDSCTLTNITQAVQVTATFALKNANLIIVKNGNGTGNVTATWTGGSLDCGAVCSAVVPSGMVVTLQASPGAGSTAAWGASCGAGPGCTVTAGAQPTTVTATFTLSKVAVTVARTGTGSVMGPAGTCVDASCPFQVDYGGSLTLTAVPGANADLGAWTGCTTTNGVSCTISGVTTPKQLQVAFAPKKIALTIQRTGKGKIINAAGTINCTDPTCVVQVDAGSTVVVQAVPDADSQFSSWAGCTTTATDSCTITGITAATQVTATFALKNASFVISRQGNGTGTVTATWPGGGSLSCGTACSASILPGTTVTLTAAPASTSDFAWGGACAGTAAGSACTVSVAAAGTTVNATFTLKRYLLSVTLSGPANSGSVLSTTSGVNINCGATCSALVDHGTVVQLTGSPAATAVFSSWTGCTAVAGMPSACTITVTAAATVTAAFKLNPGAACASSADCRLGNCVNNVCCSTACPANECTNMCQAGTGTCLYKPIRTACGTKKDGPGGPNSASEIYPACDGAGTCAWPKIKCPEGAGPPLCDLATKVCCNNDTTFIPVCTSNAASCWGPDQGDAYLGFSCGQATDCPIGLVCCYGIAPYSFSGGHWARCKAACQTGDPYYERAL